MMNWQQLISNKRLGQEHRHPERHDDRTEFKRDYDRLIFSAPFRRLQNKTQVFPLPGSVFVHNRLTHSLEVASVGMSLGNDVARLLMAAIQSCATRTFPGDWPDRVHGLSGPRLGQPALSVTPARRPSRPSSPRGRATTCGAW